MNAIATYHRRVKDTEEVISVGFAASDIASIEESLTNPGEAVVWLKTGRSISVTESYEDALDIWRSAR